MILEMLNSTKIQRNTVTYYNVDSFPLSYEDDDFDSSSLSLNHSYYDEFLLRLNRTLNKTDSSSMLSLSSPITYIMLIVISYLILTVIILTFSLYRQRRAEIENFYFGDTDEDIAQERRYISWKRLLIEKVEKGDMEPLLSDGNNQEIKTATFPLHIV
ncbi:unnamed protein product [Rotaria magnacalcarata]|uniref:Uncharacterized protein n=2 Tax=Rotaria magnacalcarata TaxID=392030 RepID=A0A816D6K8_9BILA|nr:unnamed protein product [Rotaria magnacalcarata]